MKKIILISMVAASALFANALLDVAKDAAVSEMKTAAKTEVVKQVTDTTGISTDMIKQVADKVSPDAEPKEQLKNAAVSKVMGGTDTSLTGMASSAMNDGASITDKAVDMAVDKTIGDNPMVKDLAKKAVNAVIK